MQTQARYVEPNTNLIIARKQELHLPPEYIDVSPHHSRTLLMQTNSVESPAATDVMESFKPRDSVTEEAVSPSKSEETLQVLSALDLATVGEDTDYASTSHDLSRDSGSVPLVTPATPHPDIATASEPLPGDSEMAYVFSSTVFVNGLEQGATQF